MPRYRNTVTGVVVDIPEALAASIGSYEPVDAAVPQESTVDAERPVQRRTRRKADD